MNIFQVLHSLLSPLCRPALDILCCKIFGSIIKRKCRRSQLSAQILTYRQPLDNLLSKDLDLILHRKPRSFPTHKKQIWWVLPERLYSPNINDPNWIPTEWNRWFKTRLFYWPLFTWLNDVNISQHRSNAFDSCGRLFPTNKGVAERKVACKCGIEITNQENVTNVSNHLLAMQSIHVGLMSRCCIFQMVTYCW